jgi:CheY-like chemotaxis protein
MSVLDGKRILVVEDEAIIAFALEDMLDELGCVVVGPALRLEDACVLAVDSQLDGAILDVNLNSERSYPAARTLAERGVPFIFATGYDRESLEWEGKVPDLIAKPYRKDQLEAALIRLLQ